jgi:predicted hydrocarbon binding protein
MKPAVPIDVDGQTGIWTTDGMPMIYMPRHFFLNNHVSVEKALGRAVYEKQLYDATYLSAWQWCERESATHGLTGVDVFRHYMKRVSQRGWAQFSIVSVDESTGAAVVRLDNSIFTFQEPRPASGDVCYMFAGWFPGALEWAGKNTGKNWKLASREVQCACDGSHDHCLFEITPE